MYQLPHTVPRPLRDAVLLGDVLTVLHHLGVLHPLLGLGAPHDLILGRKDSHTAPGLVQHLQPTHWECFHLKTSGSELSVADFSLK